jgi:hypothetical protein
VVHRLRVGVDAPVRFQHQAIVQAFERFG